MEKKHLQKGLVPSPCRKWRSYWVPFLKLHSVIVHLIAPPQHLGVNDDSLSRDGTLRWKLRFSATEKARKPPFVLAWCFFYWWKDQSLPKIGQVWLILQRFVCFELRPTIVASLDWGCLGTMSKSWCLLRTYRTQPHLSVLPSNIDSCSHRLRCNSVNAIWTICLNCPLRTEWSRFRGVEMWFFQKPCYLGRLVLVIKWFPVFPFHQIDVGWQQQRKEVI